jgi:hypothetical protein
MSLVEKLNDGDFFPEVEQGTVLLYKYVDSDFDESRVATSEELEELAFERGSVEAHPEGADRGGYVPTVFCGPDIAFYSDTSCEWQC